MDSDITPFVIGALGGILMIILGYISNKEDEKENKN
ncbi:hypothetical protein CLRAG_02300 [Clostridium ragsdalei P11]|uniref:Uncharacterized protein n=1 Tax=Clostridium ragsdalei P11 TaxID=1353534 RepID=A0A1A6B357_9CLOT|nr:hypothetical protein CLRAG_02300 [Clostridium ragsdalei P11]